MDSSYYLDKFQKAIDLLDQERFSQKQLDLKAGIWMDSVALIEDPETLLVKVS